MTSYPLIKRAFEDGRSLPPRQERRAAAVHTPCKPSVANFCELAVTVEPQICSKNVLKKP